MKAVKARDTKPEKRLRSLLWNAGYRYRLHVKELPGKPDIAFSAKRIAVFMHGCFWHHHECQGGRMPKNNVDFWQQKLSRNRLRDSENVAALRRQGWTAVIVWECELAAGPEQVLKKLKKELGEPRSK